MKLAQNVGAGVVGPVVWPIWFGMDFKDAAGKAAALQAWQQYLTTLAIVRTQVILKRHWPAGIPQCSSLPTQMGYI
jgi:hypothetical protein